jgi:hypothetical protein
VATEAVPCRETAGARRPWRRLIAHDLALREAASGSGCQLRRLRITWFPVVEAIRRHVLVVLGLIAQKGQLLPGLVERKVLVVALARVERPHAAVARLTRERAVLFGFRRRQPVGDPGSVAIPLEIANQRNRHVLTGRQVAQDQVVAGLFPLLTRVALGLVLCARADATRRRWRTALASACPTSAASAAAGAAARVAAMKRDPRGGFFGKADRADALDGADLTGWKRHDAGGRARRIVAPVFAAGLVLTATLVAALGALGLLPLALLFLFCLGDGEHHELGIRRERRIRTAGMTELAAGSRIPHDQLAVGALGCECVGQPFAVARERGALDRLPVVVGVVRQRLLARCR